MFIPLSRRNRKTIRARQNALRPGVESCEARQLMAASLTATLNSSGQLFVEGTPGADTIHIRQINNQISVDGIAVQTGSTSQASVAASSVSRIEVLSLAGNDRVWLGDVGQGLSMPVSLQDGVASDILSTPTTSGSLTVDSDVQKIVEMSDGTPYALHGNGILSRSQAGSWQVSDTTVTQIAAAPDSAGRTALFDLNSAGNLSELTSGGWSRIDSTITQIAAAPDRNGRTALFELNTNGNLYQMTGVGLAPVDSTIT
jgi:hypothetical protein